MAAFVYQYLVGGAIFAFGLYLAIRQGEVGLRSGAPRHRLFLLVLGLVFFAALQAFFEFVAPGL